MADDDKRGGGPMPASNTRECFRDVIGLRVVGVLFDALPVDRHDLKAGNRTLVFEDGTGLTLSNNGSYWREPAKEITRAINRKRDELADNEREMRGVLDLAGVV